MSWYLKGEFFLEPKNKDEFVDIVNQLMGDDARYYVEHELIALTDVLRMLEGMRGSDYADADQALDAVYDKLLDLT